MRKEIQTNLPFIDLKQGLLKFLRTKSYSEGTLNNYRRSLTILETYMINEAAFLLDCIVLDVRSYSTGILHMYVRHA